MAVAACQRSNSKVAESAGDATAWAMMDPGGNTRIDLEVRLAQDKARKLPSSSSPLIELGRAWVLKARHAQDPGFYTNVRGSAERALQLEPKNRLALELLAQVLASEHRFADARAKCEEVLALDPEAVVTLGVYSDVLYELGLVDAAVAAADRMTALKPNAASYVRVSFLQWLRGDAPNALKTVKLAIEAAHDPTQPEPRAYALTQAADYFYLSGDYGGADMGYQQALDAMPDYAPAMVGRGKVALAMGEPARAAVLLARAFAVSPLAETAWRLGEARKAGGDGPTALAAFEDVVRVGRRSDPRTLARFYAARNENVAEALTLAQAEMKVRPGIYTEDTLAWALHRAGRHTEALAHAQNATRLGTPDPTLVYHAGAIALAAGQRATGEKDIRRALALSPRFEAAAEAQALLDSLPKER